MVKLSTRIEINFFVFFGDLVKGFEQNPRLGFRREFLVEIFDNFGGLVEGFRAESMTKISKRISS